MKITRTILTTTILCATLSAAAGGKKKSVFIPMDYSTCGYHASVGGIPDVRNAVFVDCQSDDTDASLRLQRAIDYVSRLKADKQGHRARCLSAKARSISTNR